MKANAGSDGTSAAVIDLRGRSGKGGHSATLAIAWRTKLPPIQKLVLLYLADGGKPDPVAVAEFAGIALDVAGATLTVLEAERYVEFADER